MNFKLPVRELAISSSLILVAVLTATLYLPGIEGPLLFDDYPNLMGFVTESAVSANIKPERFLSDSGVLKRPVAMATFVFNAATSGDDFSRWKYTNVMIHLIIGLLVAWFSACLFGLGGIASRLRAWFLGTVVGAIWLLHPLQVSTVLYTVQRMTQLSALFTIGGLLAYVTGRRQLDRRKTRGWLYILSSFLVFLPLSSLSKENGVLLPLYCALIEMLFFHLPSVISARRVLLGCYAVFLVLPAVGGMIYFVVGMQGNLAHIYLARGFTLGERLLTEARVVSSYLNMLLVPVQSQMNFYHDNIEVSTGWLSPPSTLPALLFMVALPWMAWRFRRNNPVCAFGIFLFFSGHLLESTVFPLELMFEHRNYLPSMGVFLAVISGADAVLADARLKAVLTAAVLVLLAGVTFLRVDSWSSPQKLHTSLYLANPQSDSAASNYSEYLRQSGDLLDAFLTIQRNNSAAALLQTLYLQCQMIHQAGPEAFTLVASRLGRTRGMYVASAMMQLGRAGMDEHCEFPPQAYQALMDRILEGQFLQESIRYKLMFYRAHYQWKLGLKDQAINTMVEANAIYPQDPMSLFLAVEWLTEVKRWQEARTVYERAVRVAAKSPLDYSKLIDSVGEIVQGDHSPLSSTPAGDK